MIKYKNRNWGPFVTRNMSFFHECAETVGVIRFAKNFSVLPRYHIAIITENGRKTTIFQDRERIKAYNSRIIKLCLSPKIKNFKKIYERYGNCLLETSKKIERDFFFKDFSPIYPSIYKISTSLTTNCYLRTGYSRALNSRAF